MVTEVLQTISAVVGWILGAMWLAGAIGLAEFRLTFKLRRDRNADTAE